MDFDVNIGGGAEHVRKEGEERPARPKKIRPRVTLRPSIKRSGLTSTKFTEKSVINYKQGGHSQ